MPQAEGGYVSLSNQPTGNSDHTTAANATVYQTTTEPQTGSTKSVFDSVKRAIGQAIGHDDHGGGHDAAQLLSAAASGRCSQPGIVSGR